MPRLFNLYKAMETLRKEALQTDGFSERNLRYMKVSICFIIRVLEFCHNLWQKEFERSIVVYNYPYQALEESLVNAYYHRRYDEYQPVEVIFLSERSGNQMLLRMLLMSVTMAQRVAQRNQRQKKGVAKFCV